MKKSWIHLDYKNCLKFEGDVDDQAKRTLKVLGWVGLFVTWWLISITGLISDRILPPPQKVLGSYWELLVGENYKWAGFADLLSAIFTKNHLLYHIGFSTLINFLGYLEAVAIALPLGFIIALYPLPRYLLSNQLNAIRFLPIPAALGVFIALFGIGLSVKVNFLAVGILVYLLPIVVQRVLETDPVYKQTLNTLGATPFQKLKHMYIPSVLSRVFVDIIVLVAIGWTYITVIEVVNNRGGLGGIAVCASRGRSDIIYSILLLIILLGTFQDKLLKRFDKGLFKFKFA